MVPIPGASATETIYENEVMHYNGGVAVLSNSNTVYFYNDVTGAQDTADTFTPPFPSGGRIGELAATASGRVYAMGSAYVASSNSWNTYLYYKDLGSAAIGHELCTADSFFNGISWPKNYSFHPDGEGQEAYAVLVEDAVS